jgi:hypothetical protein
MKDPPVLTEYDAGWASGTIWTTFRKEKDCPYRDSNSDPLAIKPVASSCNDCDIPAPEI